MARRKAKTTRRRPRKTISVLNTAQGLAVSNILTKGMFNANLVEFFTGRQTVGRNYNPNYSDSFISLPEMLGISGTAQKVQIGSQTILSGGAQGKAGLQADQIFENLKANGLQMTAGLIVVPLGFRVARRILSKNGITRQANNLLGMAGLKEVRV